jgi:hypothetical protein
MIVLSRSPASPSSDHDNGGQTAANPVELLSHCADACKNNNYPQYTIF